MTRTVCCASAALALLAASCGERRAPRKMQVFVSIAPQACFVERVAGDLVDVHVLVGPGHSPATYAPTPRQVAALQDATVYFRIGVPFENGFLPKLRSIREDLRIVDTRHGIRLRTMGTHDHHHEAEPGHTPEDEPTHRAGMKDPHVWLDPKLVKVQAETIRRTLAELDPGALRGEPRGVPPRPRRDGRADPRGPGAAGGQDAAGLPPGLRLLRRRLRAGAGGHRDRGQGAQREAARQGHRAGQGDAGESGVRAAPVLGGQRQGHRRRHRRRRGAHGPAGPRLPEEPRGHGRDRAGQPPMSAGHGAPAAPGAHA